LFGVYAGASAENVQKCVDVIGEQFEAVRELGVTEAELHLAKEHMKGSLTLSLESSSSRMIRLGRNEFAFGRQISTEEIEARVDAVTLDEVRAIAFELFAPANLGLCVLGPVDEKKIDWSRSAA